MPRDAQFPPSPGSLRLFRILFCLALGFASLFPGQVVAQTEDAMGRSTNHLSGMNNSSEFLGSWIWDATPADEQTCQFWRDFDIPPNSGVLNARLLVTADNEFTVYLDGREIGHGAEWRELFSYNLILLLSPGRHVLAVRAFNATGYAGMLLGLQIDLADGRRLEIKSDNTWRKVPNDAKGWKEMLEPASTWAAATVIAPAGGDPWWTEPVRVNAMPTPQPIKHFFWQTVWFQVSFLAVCGLIVVMVGSLAAQVALHQKERWLLQRERARIAIDVHDDIGSRMTQLVLNGEVAQEGMPADSKTRGQLEQMCDEARGVLSSIDEILWALNPRRDTLQDFADYVCDYTQKFLSSTGIACVFEVESRNLAAAADLPLRRSLLMAIKETLNNAVKYSNATELQLQIKRTRQNLLVVVQDNGQGFDPATVPPGRNGLNNISRRMHELGGTSRITSEPGKGCRIEFCIPLSQPRRFAPPWPWRRK